MSKTVMEQAREIRSAMDAAGATLTDEQASKCAAMFPRWDTATAYKINDRVRYGDRLYKVIQDHVSQADWTPDVAVSLYAVISLDNSGFPVWSQPTGAHDAYNNGDIVNYNGDLYRSSIDGNVYSPDEYPAGWEKVE